MSKLIEEWKSKKDELNKIENVLEKEVNRIIGVIRKFFTPIDSKIKGGYFDVKPSTNYLGCRLREVPSYFDEYSLYDGKVHASGHYYDCDGQETRTVRFKVEFLDMNNSEIEADLKADYKKILDKQAEQKRIEKEALEEKKKVAAAKKVEREKEKLKTLLVKYYPDALN